MIKKLCFILTLFTFQYTLAMPIRIAIIDTGINFDKLTNKVHLCEKGLIDLSGKGINDINGHGTNIVSIITEGLDYDDYCIYIINYYSGNKYQDYLNLRDSLLWLSRNREKIDIVNISSGGSGGDWSEEYRINTLLDSGLIMVVSAGNEGQDLDKNCNFFPACYDKRLVVVGNGIPEKKLLYESSNYGKVVDVIVNGIKVCGGGVCLTGTSQAAAKETNFLTKKLIIMKRKLDNERSKKRKSK